MSPSGRPLAALGVEDDARDTNTTREAVFFLYLPSLRTHLPRPIDRAATFAAVTRSIPEDVDRAGGLGSSKGPARGAAAAAGPTDAGWGMRYSRMACRVDRAMTSTQSTETGACTHHRSVQARGPSSATSPPLSPAERGCRPSPSSTLIT